MNPNIVKDEFSIEKIETLPMMEGENLGQFEIAKVIMMHGGLKVQDSFLYRTARYGVIVPNICLINYYDPTFSNQIPLIISGQMENGQYLQIVVQRKPAVEGQENGLILRPHFAFHTDNKAPDYHVNFIKYDEPNGNHITLDGSYNVNTHPGEQNEGSVASPSNMPTGIDLNAPFSLDRSIVTGRNDYVNGDTILHTYHILLSNVDPIYRIIQERVGNNTNMETLLQALKEAVTNAGASQESATRFFSDMSNDLKNCKK